MSDKKVILITGASKGIGKACAKVFLDNGYIVIDASRTNPEPFQNDDFYFIKTDVSNEEEVKALFEKVSTNFNRLDIIINNAGYGIFKPLSETITKEFDNIFNVNVKGLYLCTRYALPIMMKQNSGTIINISSLAGKNGFAGGTLYTATKHAVMGISKSLMLEVREYNIRVSVVCPGSVDTDFFDTAGTETTSSKSTLLTSEDVAETCYLIASLPANANLSEVDIRPANPRK
jgi:NADP-dependent 3-hydroxy acid dehydrogenase YdfG